MNTDQEEFNTDVTEVDAVETARSLDLLQYQFSLEVGTGTTGSIVLESIITSNVNVRWYR